MKTICLWVVISITTYSGVFAQTSCVKTPYNKKMRTYDPQNNIIRNPGFEAGLKEWITAPNTARVFAGAHNGNPAAHCAVMTSLNRASGDALLSQEIPRLTAGNNYSLSAYIKTNSGQLRDVVLQVRFNYPNSVSQTIPVTITANGNWHKFQLNFTAPSNPNLLVTLAEVNFYRAQFDTIRVDSIEIKNRNLLDNSDFEQGTPSWLADPDSTRASIDTNGFGSSSSKCVKLTSLLHADGDARFIQQLPLLTQGNTYTLSCYLRKSNPSANLSITMEARLNYGNGAGPLYFGTTVYPTTTWQKYTYTFTVPYQQNLEVCLAQLSFYRGQSDVMFADNFELLNSDPGIIYSFVNNPVPEPPAGVFYDDFSGPSGDPLSFDKWLVVKKSWGNYYTLNNNGVVPENIELINGIGARFHGHGDLYTGPVDGATTALGNGKIRVGACIATKDYYASGNYEVYAKLTPGMINAFWTFHYIEDPSYQNGGIKNTEIDFEFPASPTSTPSEIPFYTGNKHIIDDMNLNTWGGLCNGEGVHSSLRHNTPAVDLSQGFHLYTIEWHTGGNGITPVVRWYVDGALVKEEYDPIYVGFRAARFWLGVWYAGNAWMNGHDQSVMDYEDKYMEVQWVRITPFYEPNDVYENETNPSVGYVTPQYAHYPTYDTPLRIGAKKAATNMYGTSGASNLADMKIYINPSSDQAQVSLIKPEGDFLYQIKIVDLNGKLMETISFNQQETGVNLKLDSRYKNGIYIIHSTTKKGLISSKKILITNK